MAYEIDVQKQIMLSASQAGARIFRNNTGQGWVGQVKRLSDGSILLLNPRPLHAGLCTGSSDLIGWLPTKITPEHLGKTLAVFTALEVKAGTRPTREQLTFIENVRNGGGIAGITRTPADVIGLFTQLSIL